MNRKRVVQIGIACGLVLAIAVASQWMSKRAARERYEKLTQLGVIAQRDSSGRITQINLWPKDVATSEFELLAEMPQLKMLNLADSKLTDADLRYIEHADCLEQLVLDQTQVTDAGLIRLKSLKTLQRVSVDQPVTSVGVFRLSQARPDIEIVLRPLVFHGLASLRDYGGHGALNEKYELVTLDLHDCEVEDADLKPVAACKQLRIVNLSGTSISDAGLEHLRDLENLHELWLTGTNVSDAGLEIIAGFSHLTSISLARTAVTDVGISHLKSLTALEVLHVGETKISGEGLRHLHALDKLKTVYVTQSRVTNADVSDFTDAIPSVRVFGGSEPEKPVEEIESRVLG